jgi:hypothetical protein
MADIESGNPAVEANWRAIPANSPNQNAITAQPEKENGPAA